MPLTVTNALQNEAALPVKPPSPKREFEKIIREIRTLFSQSRAAAGVFIDELIKQAEAAIPSQKDSNTRAANVSLAGSFIGAALGHTFIAKEGLQVGFQMGSKLGEGANLYNTAQQVDHQANQQRIQQAISHYSTYDQRMQTVIQAIINFIQRQQQMDQEQAALNR